MATSIAALGSYKKKIEALKAAGKQEEERQVIEEVCRYWSDKVADYLDLEINLVNPQYLPEHGPVVYVSNHQSYADILVYLKVVKHQIGFIAKEELMNIPLFSKWILRIESLFIERRCQSISCHHKPGSGHAEERLFIGDISGRHKEPV